MTIEEKYDNAIQMFQSYYDGKNESLRISSFVLEENGFGEDFWQMLCPRLEKDGILKEWPSFFYKTGYFRNERQFDQLINDFNKTFNYASEFKDFAITEREKIQKEINSMEHVYPFVTDGEKLNAVYNKVIRKSKNVLAEKVISFDDKSARILIGEISIQLPPFQNEHCLCRVIFRCKIHEPIDWSVVYKEMTGDIDEIADKTKKRSVQDTMYAVNNRVKKEANTDDALMSWRGKSIARNF